MLLESSMQPSNDCHLVLIKCRSITARPATLEALCPGLRFHCEPDGEQRAPEVHDAKPELIGHCFQEQEGRLAVIAFAMVSANTRGTMNLKIL